jgi:membrane peptidoglycan carboxypeptidase
VLQVRNGPEGERRPVAAKTGTAQDARDLATYGYLAPPKNPDQPGLAVGIWMGNSDHSLPRSKKPATSITAAAPLFQAFVESYTNDWPVAKFSQPKRVVEATIDAWSGGAPGAWTRERTKELFVRGTQPNGKYEVDQAGLLYSVSCGSWRVDPLKAELGPRAWDADVADWMRRARRGVGVVGKHDAATGYLPGRGSWGGPIAGPCPPPPRIERPPPAERPDEPNEPDRPKPTKPPKPPNDPGPKPTKPPKPPDPPAGPEEPVEPASAG